MRAGLISRAAAAFLLLAGPAVAQQVSVPLNAVPLGKGIGVAGFKTALGSGGSGAKCLTDTVPPSFAACLTVGTSSVSGGTTSTPLINVGGVLSNGTRSGNTTSFATTTGALTSGNCVKFDVSGNLVDNGAPCATSATQLRAANPTNLYVSKTGNDANSCLSSGAACLTVGHAVSLAMTNYDLQGSTLTINIGAGTYAEQVQLNGPATGQSYIILKGAGSSTTAINPSTNCGGGGIAVFANAGARVGLGSIKLGSTCTGGIGLLVLSGSYAFPIDSDLNFSAATSALIDVTGGSSFDATFAGNFPITISGGSVYAFLISTQSRVITGSGVTNVLTGTPAFSGAFVDAIDGSFFNWGSSSTWSGSATGIRYALALNSYIDSEQITTNLPGNSPGTIGSGSHYYTNGSLTCVGSSASCRIATAATGFGTSPTFAVISGSGDQAGSFGVTAGTGPSSSGTVVLATPSIMTGPVDTAGFCTVSLSNANTPWPTPATVQSTYTSGGINIAWTAGSALTATGTYYFNYTCQ